MSENLLKSTLFEIAAPGPKVFEDPFLEMNYKEFVLPRSAELSCVTWSLGQLLNDIGLDCSPFQWNEERRFLIRCELDAAFFHLYLPVLPSGEWKRALVAAGAAHDESPEDLAQLKASFPTPRDAVAYIMDTFHIVRRRDEEKYDGDYRTKRVILEIYDETAEAIRTGISYQTRLDPPPADPSIAHPYKL